MRPVFQPMLARVIVLFLVALAPTALAQAQPDGFVRVENGHFVLDGKPYYFTGTNLWFGMNMGSEGPGGDRARLVRELDRLAALGVTNLRVMAATEGPDTEPWRVKPAVQQKPGVYDETVLRGLDFLLAEMGKRNMKAVMVLNNFFHWSGGMAQYVSWATGTPIIYPDQDGHTWMEFVLYASQFYVTPEAQRYYLDYLHTLIYRKNHITGRLYRDDPAIMAWQLANEPRGHANSDQYVEWVDKAAGFIQLNDPNHLVSLGGEGKVVRATGTQFERVSRSPYLDYLTIHIWIENWDWYEPTQPEETFPIAIGRAMGYLADHTAIARAVGKPLVVEEFGAGRDRGAFDLKASTVYRDRYYQIMYEAVLKLASEGAPVAGTNVWAWAGEGRPKKAGTAWKVGDDFTGDPPHEMQGWYSIYDSDRSTVALLERYAREMNALNVAPGTASTTGSN